MAVNNQLLPWHKKNWDLLNGYINQDRIPQALLITGVNGLGKYSLATQFASSLFCSNILQDGFSCGKCNGCLLIKSGTHPDLFLISPEPEKTAISINQIRQVITDSYLKPQFETYRVIIINPADVMTTAAANAFLKCLEEPTERTVLILITDKPNKLPATIISRCQKLLVKTPDKQVLSDWLKGQGIEQDQETLIRLMRSSVLTMQQIADEGFLKQRTDCFNDWLAVAKHKSHPVIISEKWQKLSATEVINWLTSWVTDIIKCANHVSPEQICNQDMAKPIQELSRQLNLSKLFGLYDKLLVSRRQIGTQINFQMMLEEILIQWQDLNGRT
jgi:DNA polymerase-3 subunit delta'